jgi:hypothetical protein
MDKSSAYRGVSRKKGRWEAKVLLNRKWAYREQFDAEEEAARAYDVAVWRLKPREAANYANFKDTCPEDVTQALAAADRVRTAQASFLSLSSAAAVEGAVVALAAAVASAAAAAAAVAAAQRSSWTPSTSCVTLLLCQFAQQ